MRAIFLLATIIATVFTESEVSQDSPTEERAHKLSRRWTNQYQKPLQFTCPGQDTINTIISQPHNRYEDRMWDFTCKTAYSGPVSCHWSSYINEYDEPFTYSCPWGFISGFHSIYHKYYEDRRWRIYCCSQSSNKEYDCQWTDYINDFGAYMYWQVRSERYLTGVASFHHSYYKDRRWKFEHCVEVS
ncbi:hemagglutinin/amebocyte aggregation factor-like [Lissotriton helveticus]